MTETKTEVQIPRAPAWFQAAIVVLLAAMAIQCLLHLTGVARLGSFLAVLFVTCAVIAGGMLAFNTTALDPFSHNYATRSVRPGAYWTMVVGLVVGAAWLLAWELFVQTQLDSL